MMLAAGLLSLCLCPGTGFAADQEIRSKLEEASALADKGDAETLFLRFASTPVPEGMAEGDRATLARILKQGAAAAKDDDFIAHGLLSRAIALKEDASTLAALADVEIRLGQRGGAKAHLVRADELASKAPTDPKAGEIALSLGMLRYDDGDMEGAATDFRRAASLGAPHAREWQKRAEESLASDRAEEARFRRDEAELTARLETARKAAVQEWLAKAQAQVAMDDAAPGGVRQTQSVHFAFMYTTSGKTLAEIHSFDGRVGPLMDMAYDHVSKTLGHRLDRKIPVLLMTKDEYQARHGQSWLGRAAAFWDGQRIVMNGNTEIDGEFMKIMVHELTHAFVRELIGHRSMVPTWANEGLAEYVAGCATQTSCGLSADDRADLRRAVRMAPDITLRELDGWFHGAGSEMEVHAAYVVSEAAVTYLAGRESLDAYVAALKDMRNLLRADTFDRALKKHFKVTTKDVEDAIGLKRR